MITFTHKGNFRKTTDFLKKASNKSYMKVIQSLAQEGVDALSSATPKDSGVTASSWSYEIEDKGGVLSIYWKNTNVNKGVNIAIILQYGHGTGTGGYVRGTDYINPAIKPIFDNIADGVWKEVTSK